ncbi:ABC transporter permease [Marinilactibacillus sp. GCM10026970]|uniref:ABC transporter permease n=1 Tax=Marinilactibacillus sp. GCM10026970 TaxID=3252642 RepID=UPI00361675E6
MLTIFFMQWKRTLKSPLLLILFFGLTILMVNVVAGTQGGQMLEVAAYSENLSEDQIQEKLDRLNQSDTIRIHLKEKDQVEEDIKMDKYGFALVLKEDNYQILVGRETQQLPVVDQYVRRVYSEENRLSRFQEQSPEQVIEVKEHLLLNASSLSDTGNSIVNLSVMLGMTFYFTIFSILFLMTDLFEDKRNGIWNRLIFSPVSKVKIYLGHLLFYVSLGILQIMILITLLSQMLSLDLNINYPIAILIVLSFILCIVSLGILLIAIAKSSSGLMVLIPIIATSTAMLGGAFWPLQVINNRFLLFVAEWMPIKQAVYGIVEATVQNKSFFEAIQPVGILLVMSLFFMSIGINMMERVSESQL